MLDTVNPPVAVAVTGVTDSSFTPTTGLHYNRTYYWQVIGLNISRQEAPGEVWQFNTPPPAAPTLSSPANSATNVSLTPTLVWSDTSGVISYHLQVATDSVFTSPIVNDSTSTSMSMTIASSLANGTTYYWRVNASMAAATSGWSPVWSFTTLSTWSALGSGTNGFVLALAVDGFGNLYAGGNFSTAGGVAANHVAKWNGSAWSALGSGTSGVVNVLAVDGSGNLYAGGNFTTAGSVTANYVAKWDGSAWSALGSGMSGGLCVVYAFAFDSSGNVYAGGWFTTAGGAAANYIAKWK